MDLKFDASGRGQSVASHFALHDNRLDVHDVSNAISISPRHLVKVVSAIKDADFFSLPTDLCIDPLQHTGSAYLDITMNGRTHHVDLCAWAMQRDMNGAKRLERISRALLSAWSSPNDNKELRWFKESPGGLSFQIFQTNHRAAVIALSAKGETST